MKLTNFKLVTVICEPVLSSVILSISQDLGATGFAVTEVSGLAFPYFTLWRY